MPANLRYFSHIYKPSTAFYILSPSFGGVGEVSLSLFWRGWGGLCLSPLKGELEGVLWVGEVPLSPIPLQRYCFSAIFVGKVVPIMHFLSILNPFFSSLITDRHPIVHCALRIVFYQYPPIPTLTNSTFVRWLFIVPCTNTCHGRWYRSTTCVYSQPSA